MLTSRKAAAALAAAFIIVFNAASVWAQSPSPNQIDLVTAAYESPFATPNHIALSASTSIDTIPRGKRKSVAVAGNNVTVAGSNGADGPYLSLQAAFAAINGKPDQSGKVITISIIGDPIETGTAILNQPSTASWTSLTITPVGARTISGSLALPLIDMNSADNVKIDGLNAGGNSLTISNTSTSGSSGTSTIRFINGATGNTVTNATILGSFTGGVVNTGGTILFNNDTVSSTGNKNNTVSKNNIGPAGVNLPTTAIDCVGSTGASTSNTGNVVDDNNIYDFFGPATASAGYYANSGCNTSSITNNRFYQTAARTWTTGSQHFPIWLSDASSSTSFGFTITGNTIGYASSTQTGTYTLSGTGSGAKFAGIYFAGKTNVAASNINSNVISDISMTGVSASGQAKLSPFAAIICSTGNAVINGNTIGSQNSSGSLTFTTNSGSVVEVQGIYNGGSDPWTSNSNKIGGITVTNSGAGTTFFYGLRGDISSSLWTANTNSVGGTSASSVQLNATSTASQAIGMSASSALTSLTGNTIRNISSNAGTGTGASSSVIGISAAGSNQNQTLSQNTVYALANTNASGASTVAGIQFSGTATNVVERSLIYGLGNSSSSGVVNGIAFSISGGTTTFRNNIVAVGNGLASTQVNGILESSSSGTGNLYHNSIYVGGTATSGSVNSYALNSSVNSGTRVVRDNIFYNARANGASATGKHYAIQIASTSGLTINNNDYFANGAGGVFGRLTSDISTLAAWKTATLQDAQSINIDPLLADSTNAVPDLHLQQGSGLINAGVTIAGITNDYDNDVRPLYAGVDVGADEVVDSTAPDTLILTMPAAASSSSSAAFTFSGSDVGGSGLQFDCKVDSGAFAACSSPVSFTVVDGQHTFQVRGRDGAGNLDATPASWTWTVDTAPPDTAIQSAPPNPSRSSTPTFAFGSNEAGVSFQCKLDNAAFAACSSPMNLGGVADGSHTFQVRATDAAGNIDPTPASYAWTVDTAGPVIQDYAPVASTTSNAAQTLTVIATDAGGTGIAGIKVWFSVNGGPFSSIDCAASGNDNCSIPGQVDGTAVAYYVEATDNAGNALQMPNVTAPNLYTVGTNGAVIPAGRFSNADLTGGSSLAGDVAVTGELRLSGQITTGANVLELGCAAFVTVPAGTNYVIGNVKKDFCSPGSFTFPVGTAPASPVVSAANAPQSVAKYSPVSVNVTAVSGPSSLTVAATDTFLSGIATSTAVSRYWTLTETGDLTADLTFNYLDEDVNGDESAYQIFRRENGVDAPMGGTVTPAGNSAAITGVSSFSQWGIGTALAPTAGPVSLSGRVVTANGQGIKNAAVTVSGNGSAARTNVITGPFGYYQIDGLTAGETYVVTVNSRSHAFAQPNRIVTMNDSLANIDFTANP